MGKTYIPFWFSQKELSTTIILRNPVYGGRKRYGLWKLTWSKEKKTSGTTTSTPLILMLVTSNKRKLFTMMTYSSRAFQWHVIYENLTNRSKDMAIKRKHCVRHSAHSAPDSCNTYGILCTGPVSAHFKEETPRAGSLSKPVSCMKSRSKPIKYVGSTFESTHSLYSQPQTPKSIPRHPKLQEDHGIEVFNSSTSRFKFVPSREILYMGRQGPWTSQFSFNVYWKFFSKEVEDLELDRFSSCLFSCDKHSVH